jgi:hypothetical protein
MTTRKFSTFRIDSCNFSSRMKFDLSKHEWDDCGSVGFKSQGKQSLV